MSIDIEIPRIGESVTTVFIARWLKEPGQAVKQGEGIVEIDSDKASMEVPAPRDGVLETRLAEEGDEVEVGSVVARLGEGSGEEAAGDDGDSAAAADAESEESEKADEAKQPEPSQKPALESRPRASEDDVRAGPAARQVARDKGVALDEVQGTGRHGRVTRQDVERAAATGGPREQARAPQPAPAIPGDRVERIPMSPLRRTIARRLVEVQQTAAILTTFNEIDMSAVMALRKQYQPQFTDRYGIKLGFMSFFVKAAVSALMEFPAVNGEVDGNDLVYKNYYNIGVAVSGPKGLVVPVLRDADRLSFAGVEKGIAELAQKARDNKLSLADFQDGTFTISNGGIFGSMMSTPILNPPQVGILGMHNIVKRAVVVEGEQGDEIAIRPMMYVALSYDHRIIDGREAVSFLKRVKELVEDPERILLEA